MNKTVCPSSLCLFEAVQAAVTFLMTEQSVAGVESGLSESGYVSVSKGNNTWATTSTSGTFFVEPRI